MDRPVFNLSVLRAAVWLGCMALSASASPASWADPVVVEPVALEISGMPVRGYSAKIDLSDRSVEVVVTAALAKATEKDGKAVEAILTPTDQWAKEQGMVLAINGNYFGKLGKLDKAPQTEAEEARGFYRSGEASDIVGLSISNGVVVSPVREHGGRGDPALVIRKDHSAVVGYLTKADLAQAEEGLAGVGGGEGDALPGTLLVQDGSNLGSTARVEPTVRHPRTAIGVSADGKTLIIVVIDGRQPGYSAGMTLPELGDLMIKLGARDAINLDGGGSSSLVYAPIGGEQLMNKPSDGKFRAVANHLGVRIKNGAAAPAK